MLSRGRFVQRHWKSKPEASMTNETIAFQMLRRVRVIRQTITLDWKSKREGVNYKRAHRRSMARTSVYAVGRAELLDWLNSLLGLGYTSVEDAGNGAAFCQVIDAVHPNSVPLGRVNFNASSEAERIENYKILQDAFAKNGISQYIDVKNLCRGRMMATLELLQWIHGYYVQAGAPSDYDGHERRRQTRCREPASRGRASRVPPARGPASAKPLGPPSVTRAARPLDALGAPAPATATKALKAIDLAPKVQPRAQPKVASMRPVDPAVKAPLPAPGDARAGHWKQEAARLQEELEQMKQERDFYYDKLRKVEEICQDNEDDAVVQQVIEVLYEADPEKGFLPPEEEDE
jgi:RP/EB family microtubule-associated protein